MLDSARRRSLGRPAPRLLVALTVGLVLLFPAAQALAADTSPTAPGASALQPAASASVLSFDSMRLSVLPEYDQPGPQVLVIIRGALVNRGTEPVSGQKVVFRAPKGATWTAIAELSSDPLGPDEPVYHELRSQAKVTEQSDYVELALEMTKTVKPGELYPLQAEFYYPGVVGAADKSVQLIFLPTYPAKTLLLDIAEPKGAQGFNSSLGAGNATQGPDGLTYLNYTLPGLDIGTPFRVDLAYKRTSNDPSVNGTPLAGESGTAAGGAQSGGGADTTALVVGVLVLGALAGLLLFSGAGTRSGRTGRAARQGGPLRSPAGGGGDARARAKDLLLEGRISQDTYRLLVAELDAEEGR